MIETNTNVQNRVPTRERVIDEAELIQVENACFFPGMTESEIKDEIQRYKSAELGKAVKVLVANGVPIIPPSKEQRAQFFNVPTAEIVADLLRHKRLHLVADEAIYNKQTMPTYEKVYSHIARIFPHLPLEIEPLQNHLLSLRGKSGRTRYNEWGYLNQIYKHAKRFFNLSKNPMNDIDRPRVKKSVPNPLSWDQVTALLKTPESVKEQAALHIYLGHGWRPPGEGLKIRAGDVRRAADGCL